MARGRGGSRTPRNPAPASGPGAASRRTDGGAANPPSVPAFSSPTGERPYGERKAVEQMAATPTPNGGPNPAPGGGGGMPLVEEGAFGPTMRPGEPPTAGMPFGPGPGPSRAALPQDPNMLLRALVQVDPHPDLIRLLNRA